MPTRPAACDWLIGAYTLHWTALLAGWYQKLECEEPGGHLLGCTKQRNILDRWGRHTMPPETTAKATQRSRCSGSWDTTHSQNSQENTWTRHSQRPPCPHTPYTPEKESTRFKRCQEFSISDQGFAFYIGSETKINSLQNWGFLFLQINGRLFLSTYKIHTQPWQEVAKNS